ncbi:probable acyl-activating enzyme 16, chloroplastic isoform X2 [Phaseolus vulgaris]|uniref:probable acyl-activating enzyme 16, chloroplastic isoform X2 n=1 Tax=Phaseolus vulgaris TaxID=3885 RepID=UPI0035CBD1DD
MSPPIPISSSYASTFSYSAILFPFVFARNNFTGIKLHPTVFCQFEPKTEKPLTRRCSPFLESSLLSGSDVVASDEWKAVPDIWRSSAEKYGDKIALVDPYHDPPSTMTYKELEDAILDFAEGLRVIGVRPYEKLALFADNSCRWLVADQGKHYMYEAIKSDDIATLVYTSGTTGNPKGVMLTHQNLLHQIKNLGDIVPAEVGDRFLSMLPSWHAYERASEYFIFSCGVEQVYTTVRKLKDDLRRYQPHYLISVPLVYETLYSGIQKQISTSSLVRKLVALTFIRASLRYMECRRIYEGKCLMKDQKPPSYLHSMLDWLWARIIATILFPVHLLATKLVYSKIHSAIGISKAGISGGGSLSSHVDRFFEAIGVTVQNGYGLTETSPVIAARQLSCNVIGSVGHPIKHTEFKVIDSETDEVLPPGSKGILKVRGPQLMKGYYKNPSATNQVLDRDGWLNTGDIGWIVPHHSTGRSRNSSGVIVVDGRAKDTIVLSTGENVEPGELEEAAMRSSLIHQIVVIGQDKRRLGAVIVPNNEEVLKAARESSIIDPNSSDVVQENVTSLICKELRTWTSESPFQIGPVLVVNDPFTIDNGLMTPTMKIRRDKVVAQYRDQIENLYK